jgi:hypothetical protein
MTQLLNIINQPEPWICLDGSLLSFSIQCMLVLLGHKSMCCLSLATVDGQKISLPTHGCLIINGEGRGRFWISEIFFFSRQGQYDVKLDRRRVVDKDVAVTGLRCMDCLGTSFASFFYKMQNRQMECQKKMCNIVLPRFKIVKPVLSILKKIMRCI